MTAEMTPTWKAAVPKISSTVWVHLDVVVDTARVLETSLLLLLVGVEKAKEKRMGTPTHPWRSSMAFSVAKVKCRPCQRPCLRT